MAEDLLSNRDKPEHIICAAIHFMDGKVYPHPPKNIDSGLVICGRRHHNCFTTYHVLKGFQGQCVQGFMTSKDRFVDRAEAAKIAFEQKQVPTERERLFSEDLY